MALIDASKTTASKDGRTLEYDECGAPEGKPFFEFYGNSLPRLGSQILNEAARFLATVPTKHGLKGALP